MQKISTFLVGSILVLVGLAALGINLFAPHMLARFALSWLAVLWPLAVIGLGLFFLLLPFLIRRRGMAALLVLAAPILTTGAILAFANLTGWWEVWSAFWPLEVLSLALGFLAAALYARSIWLAFPMILLGVNGLVLQFCALTGLWETWSFLWTAEPLALGLAFLVVAAPRRSVPLGVIGLVLCAVAGLGLAGMAGIFLSQWWIFRLVWPAAILLVGILLLLVGLVQTLRPGRPAADAGM